MSEVILLFAVMFSRLFAGGYIGPLSHSSFTSFFTQPDSVKICSQVVFIVILCLKLEFGCLIELLLFKQG